MNNKKEILYNPWIELVKLQKEIISSNLKLLVIIEGSLNKKTNASLGIKQSFY